MGLSQKQRKKRLEPFYETFGARLKALRLERGLTQQQLSERTPFARNGVNAIESGMQRVNAHQIPLLAIALETSCEYLLTGEDR